MRHAFCQFFLTRVFLSVKLENLYFLRLRLEISPPFLKTISRNNSFYNQSTKFKIELKEKELIYRFQNKRILSEKRCLSKSEECSCLESMSDSTNCVK
ncbi:hypothetical protein BpHYR1_036957 [Brachionus plicatilis]|uniref:Uncharacterized protein n=1 Tax=Brachionus plicatilis TaxID=10195 RepID=A0A3M7S9L5_BRAPC|nr:hypothetical protein BpHYR1_036957 [Brachionus plicatilis]